MLGTAEQGRTHPRYFPMDTTGASPSDALKSYLKVIGKKKKKDIGVFFCFFLDILIDLKARSFLTETSCTWRVAPGLEHSKA